MREARFKAIGLCMEAWGKSFPLGLGVTRPILGYGSAASSGSYVLSGLWFRSVLRELGVIRRLASMAPQLMLHRGD